MACFAQEAAAHRLASCLMEKNRARICVPVCVPRAVELAAAATRAAEVADIVELRLDCLTPDEREAGAPLWGGVLNQLSVPVILTLRSADQGGHSTEDFAARRRFWSSFENLPENSLIDLEIDLVCDFGAAPAAESPVPWSRVICSHHDFLGVPFDLEQIYERMAATPARILKIAVRADDAVDCLPIFHLLERARCEGREMIAIAMGQAGMIQSGGRSRV